MSQPSNGNGDSTINKQPAKPQQLTVKEKLADAKKRLEQMNIINMQGAGATVTDIAKTLDVSRNTVYRRLSEVHHSDYWTELEDKTRSLADLSIVVVAQALTSDNEAIRVKAALENLKGVGLHRNYHKVDRKHKPDEILRQELVSALYEVIDKASVPAEIIDAEVDGTDE